MEGIISLRFLHLATTLRGGAGIAAVRLHQALQAEGHASQVFTHEGADGHEDVRPFETPVSLSLSALSKIWHKFSSREKYYFRDDAWCFPGTNLLVDAAKRFDPDVIVAHFLTGFVDFQTVARLRRATGAPVIFYLMDMAPMTGGCHFAWECRRYEVGCGNCPALYFGRAGDKSAKVVDGKVSALSSMPHMVVTGAKMLSSQAGTSQVFRNSVVRTVPLAIDDKLFAPRDRDPLRKKFGLSAHRPTLFFGSRSREQKRKGIPVLKRALKQLATQVSAEKLPQLLVAGDGPDFKEFFGEGYSVRSLGPVGLDVLAECYSVADVFVSPSLEDAGPMMINEAVMSGCPVVAFRTGVAIDLIEDGTSGLIVSEVGNADALAATLEEIIGWTQEQFSIARERAKDIGAKILAPPGQAQAFAEVVNTMIRLGE